MLGHLKGMAGIGGSQLKVCQTYAMPAVFLIGPRYLVQSKVVRSVESDMDRRLQGFEEPMSRGEAAKILGISASSDKAIVAKVHRKLMILNHPDRGGSPYLATKVNEAKEVLLGKNQNANPFR
jgi:hypothetical protein